MKGGKVKSAVDRIGSVFLRRILLRMKELGVSQTELARRMQVTKPYVTKVLHQDVNFSFRTAAKLAQALGMDFFPELRECKSEKLKSFDEDLGELKRGRHRILEL